MARDPNDDDRFALYAHAHADLWWAKTQEWNAANWALLLIAGIVGTARTLIPSSDLSWRTTWHFAGMTLAVGLAAGWYLASLHADIVHSRKVYRALEKETGVGELRKAIPKRAGEQTDRERGSGFLYVMCAGVGLAVGLAFELMAMPTWVAVLAALAVFLTGFIMIARAA